MTPITDFSSDTDRWQAIAQRDSRADGAFVYGVATTGIYCRPGCASRTPRRENVRYFDDGPTAEAAGFRPCKRCTPQAAHAPNPTIEAVAQACKIIDEAEREPSLAQLAAAVGLSVYHFQRLFRKTVGVTPKQYAMEKRLGRVRDNLQQNSTVTEAVYEAGYESGSRFYETATAALGMKPADYQKGGEGLLIRYAVVQSYLGWVLIAATAHGICRIDFGDAPDTLLTRLTATFPEADLQGDDPAFTTMAAQTLVFLESPREGLALPLDIQGTAFQRRVWSALQEIQPGVTASYADIARRIGQPTAARAVAQACAANNIAVAIPCHRVVRSDGDLGGYRWGVERKRAILAREAVAATAGE
jgi:AraC family transcriptional regulator of adaptative response/methylated-DNA-[protein]-cysteine methyltransferase